MSDSSAPRTLPELRAAIDAVDDEILALIQHRAALAAEVGRRKHVQGSGPFYVPSREASIIRRLLGKNGELAAANHATKIPDEAVHGIYREIIGACLALEHPLTIAYLGPEGTFSHSAATRQFGATAHYTPCANFEAVFDEVESGRVTYAVVPVENAFEGAVTPTLDLFADMERSVQICAEIQLSIHHHLFSHAADLREIATVISHPQPLGHCRQWLRNQLPQAQLLESSSTVRGAELILDAKNGAGTLDWRTSAVIGPESIADRFDLPLLARNIEDHHDNTTRFFVIGNHDSPASGEDKTGLVISVKDVPGALFNVIRPFAERGIGLSRIESRPSKRKLWEYLFLVDLIGHRDDANVAEALAELRAMHGVELKLLGSYPVSRKL